MNFPREPKIQISEIFGPTIQGEGVLIGLPTVFVRTGGCDYRCVWCDSLHAVDSQYRAKWKRMTAKQIWKQISALSDDKPLVVSLSGGNPATQPLTGLIDMGHQCGYSFALETQGSVSRDWFSSLDFLVLSPKPPSSKMETNWEQLETCFKVAGLRPEIVLKVVVFDDSDYQYAKEVTERFPSIPIYLQPGNYMAPAGDEEDAPLDQSGLNEKMRWLVDKVLKDNWFDARVLPQLHVILWGNKRGV